MRTRKQRGGEVIGKGMNAKAIYPAPSCKTRKTSKNLVARLPFKNPGVLTEYPEIVKRLKEIDPTQKYLYYPMKCKIGKLTAVNKKDGITEKNKHMLELFKRGTRVWYDHKHPEKNIPPTEEQIQYLLKIVNFLHSRKIVHGDLHGSNIVIAEEDDMPRLIDFEYTVIDAPQDIIDREASFLKRGLPNMNVYEVFDLHTEEGHEKHKIGWLKILKDLQKDYKNKVVSK